MGAVPLSPSEVWFDVVVLMPGLNVPAPLQIAPDVSLDIILASNTIATAARIASDVVLGRPSDDEAPTHPVCGMRYRVRGRRPTSAGDYRFNEEAISRPKILFRRALALIRGIELIHGGTFVTEEDWEGRRHVHSYQLNVSTIAVHYDSAYFDESFAPELREVYAALDNPYMEGDGTVMGVAIDRLGAASLRTVAVDQNIDYCIAAEIAFMYGVRDPRNAEIAETIRENAKVFFGDGEFFWTRDEVYEIVCGSYRERSHTMHGRLRPGRQDILAPFNARLREVIKAVLLAYVKRRPTRHAARAAWPERRRILVEGGPLSPIFLP